MEVLETYKHNRMQVLIPSVKIRSLNPTFRARMNMNISLNKSNSNVVISTKVRATIPSAAHVMTSKRYQHSTQERNQSLPKRIWNHFNLMSLRIISKRQSQFLAQPTVVQSSTHWQHNTTRSSLPIRNLKPTNHTKK